MGGAIEYASSPALLPQRRFEYGHRTWYRHWFNCCGECDNLGWSSCLLTFFCPCVSFGLNRQRAFAQSAVLWGLVFFILVVLRTSYCRRELKEDSHSTYYHNYYSDYGESSRRTSDREYEWVCSGVFHSIFSWTAALFCEILVGIALIVLGTINRTGLRNKFDLPGDVCTDCLLWTFCPSCVLCQETRTLWYNSVKDGVWNGPPQVYVVPDDQDAMNDATPCIAGHQAAQKHLEMQLGHTAPPRQQLAIGHAYPAEQENVQAVPTV